MDQEKLSHVDEDGRLSMVDVTGKAPTQRVAVARGRVAMSPAAFAQLSENRSAKGNILECARLAGIMAAKKTAEMIPLCHPLMLTHVALDFFPDPDDNAVDIEAAVKTTGQTGVEMEALCAVSVAALTVYDMLKAVDKTMRITDIRLAHKSGGKSGVFQAG
ncbi:MAG: cyclic pyranopterin monophosphate synthase MoaC [Thermodesulfobacteriota bacterium]